MRRTGVLLTTMIVMPLAGCASEPEASSTLLPGYSEADTITAEVTCEALLGIKPSDRRYVGCIEEELPRAVIENDCKAERGYDTLPPRSAAARRIYFTCRAESAPE